MPHISNWIYDLGTPATLELAIAERNMWVESAAMFSRDADYYRGLVDQIAEAIGVEAFTSDDGSIQDSPVRAKLPELVSAKLGLS